MFLIGDHSIEVVDLASGLDADWVLPIFINALLIHIQLQDSIDAIFANDPDHVFLLKYHPWCEHSESIHFLPSYSKPVEIVGNSTDSLIIGCSLHHEFLVVYVRVDEVVEVRWEQEVRVRQPLKRQRELLYRMGQLPFYQRFVCIFLGVYRAATIRIKFQ